LKIKISLVRIGSFKVSEEMFFTKLKVLEKVFSQLKIVPIKIEHEDGNIIYTAFSKYFDEIKEGNLIPEYSIIIKDGKKVEIEKIIKSGVIKR